jgi:Zn-dependent peptidase ImmA (M78 family)
MTLRVPYIADDAIERDAAALLAQYAYAKGVEIRAAIPIEDIVEKHLKLHVEFDDTHRLFGVPRDPECDADAIFFDERRMVIDESLDPEERPHMEGRYRFTLAHEGGGHWRLHRGIFAKDRAQAALFGRPESPSFVCRSSEAKKREEWQADFYASCLLMPRNLVIEAWRERFGNTNARILKRKNRLILPGDVSDEIATLIRSYDRQRDDEAMNEFVRLSPKDFWSRWSPCAMRLGLLHREVPRQRSFTASA